MKLRTKFAIWLAVFTLVLALIMVGGLEAYKNNQIAESERNVNETAALAAEQIATEMNQRMDYVGYVASRRPAREFDASEEYLTEFLANSRFYSAQIIQANGTVLAFQGSISEDVREQTVGSDLSSEPYVRAALDGRTYVSDAEYATGPDEHVVIISAPIVGADGNVRGVLATAMYLDEQNALGSVTPLQTDHQTVTVTAGEMVITDGGKPFEQAIVANATVPDIGWQVTVAKDASGLFQQLRWLALAQGGGLLLLLGLIVGFGYWQYSTNLRQTEQLLEAFDNLKRGQFDHSLSLTAAEEWEQIGDGFNEMATRLEERERALREREQRLSVFNRVLRHNLRNDMNVILAHLEALPDYDDPEQIRQAVEKSRSKAQKLLSHSDKARALETAMQRMSGERVSLDVVSLVEDAIEEYRAEYPGVTVRTTLPDEKRVIAIHSLEHAIDNVVENAFEHNDSDSPIVSVELTETDGQVALGIADNGPGIPEYERRIFAEDSEESSLEHSSGLGLWIAYWIVDKSLGDLRFEDGIDGGTMVELVFESAPAESAGEDIEASDAIRGATTGN